MPASVNPFYDCTGPELVALRAQYLECIGKLAIGQQYTIAGRQLTRADLNAVKETFAQITAAIGRQSGKQSRRVYAGVFRRAR